MHRGDSLDNLPDYFQKMALQPAPPHRDQPLWLSSAGFFKQHHDGVFFLLKGIHDKTLSPPKKSK